MTAKDKQSPVAVVVGSDSDLEVMQFCIRQLKEFGIEPQVRVLSAHRTPAAACEFAQSAAGQGIRVIIAAAGMAAHLAGALAGQTPLPVIGVPLAAKAGRDGAGFPAQYGPNARGRAGGVHGDWAGGGTKCSCICRTDFGAERCSAAKETDRFSQGPDRTSSSERCRTEKIKSNRQFDLPCRRKAL